jgi:hypothetical protein
MKPEQKVSGHLWRTFDFTFHPMKRNLARHLAIGLKEKAA